MELLTFNKPHRPAAHNQQPSDPEPRRESILVRLNGRLEALDAEQLQIVEIVIVAIVRGGKGA